MNSNWKCVERCDARNYTDREERVAFRSGYSDGWYGYPMGSSGSDSKDWPNAYGAGYHEGAGDKKEQPE